MKYILIAAQAPDGWDLEDVIQSTMEAVGDLDGEELTVIDEADVPSSAKRFVWT